MGSQGKVRVKSGWFEAGYLVNVKELNPFSLETTGLYPRSFLAFAILYLRFIFTNERSKRVSGGCDGMCVHLQTFSTAHATGLAIKLGSDFDGMGRWRLLKAFEKNSFTVEFSSSVTK